MPDLPAIRAGEGQRDGEARLAPEIRVVKDRSNRTGRTSISVRAPRQLAPRRRLDGLPCPSVRRGDDGRHRHRNLGISSYNGKSRKGLELDAVSRPRPQMVSNPRCSGRCLRSVPDRAIICSAVHHANRPGCRSEAGRRHLGTLPRADRYPMGRSYQGVALSWYARDMDVQDTALSVCRICMFRHYLFR